MSKLDADFVRKVEPPTTGAITFWDDDPKLTGFGLRVYAGGGKSFFLNYRIDGREKRYTIGPWPRWTPAAARERAKELRKLIDQGHDPAGAKRSRREAPTIEDLIARFVTEHLPQKSKIAMRVRDEMRMLDAIGKHLGLRTRVADVHGGDIAMMHKRMSEAGASGKPAPVRANRCLAVASKMFSLALVPCAGENAPWRDQAQGNPCRGIQRNPEQGRSRFFSEAELAVIAAALDEHHSPAADCLKLLMLTGARPMEAMRARWSEFDEQGGFWIKPAATVKQRRMHALPLSAAALVLVDQLRKTRTGDWVFPGRGGNGHITSLDYAWQHVRDRAGLGATARPYDLRHSFASIGAAGGLSLVIIGKLLGHTQAATTSRYAHLAADPLRAAAEKITSVITNAGKPGAAVVSIKR